MLFDHVTKDISAYCHGELSPEESKQFAEHIISCSKCRIKYEEIKIGIRLAEHLPQATAPDHLWTGLEASLNRQLENQLPITPGKPSWFLRPQVAAIAALIILAMGFAVFWNYRNRIGSPVSPSWEVQSLGGTPRIGSSGIQNQGQLRVGQWLETDANSRAEISVASIGQVQIDPNTRVKLIGTQPNEHRLELAKGRLSARIWAPPRLFFVDTPSAVAADLGCAYTLEVDDSGGSLLRVTSGWVALQLKDRESMVPAGAACQTRPGIGPGTPYFEEASPVFREALLKFDFGSDALTRSAALARLLQQPVDDHTTLTLWHLLSRVEGNDRVQVYEALAKVWPPPKGVTREGILNLDHQMLERWKDNLAAGWISRSVVPTSVADAWWKIRNAARQVKRTITQ